MRLLLNMLIGGKDGASSAGDLKDRFEQCGGPMRIPATVQEDTAIIDLKTDKVRCLF